MAKIGSFTELLQKLKIIQVEEVDEDVSSLPPV